jgi:hypothetical protein
MLRFQILWSWRLNEMQVGPLNGINKELDTSSSYPRLYCPSLGFKYQITSQPVGFWVNIQPNVQAVPTETKHPENDVDIWYRFIPRESVALHLQWLDIHRKIYDIDVPL